MAKANDTSEEMQLFLEKFKRPENAFLEYTLVDKYALPRNILKEFVVAKRGEGCSVETLRSYFQTIRHLLLWFQDRPILEITGSDMKAYLTQYQTEKHVSNSTLDNMRRNFNSFFNYLCVEDYIDKNPMLRVRKIKSDTTLKLPFTEEELERIRDACGNIRELALVDFLYSTGVRVSELVNCDIHDINLQTQEGVVYGKGGKERMVYLDTRSKLHVERYLQYRCDKNPALFVGPNAPYLRVTKGGVEYILRDIGHRAHVENVHPHRFRRTLATRLLERGMPIEQVQAILGHSKMDTTLIYAKVSQTGVKLNHGKYA